mgnify:CR=1 FL=1
MTTYKRGDVVISRWGPSVIVRAVEGGTYLLAWYGLATTRDTVEALHFEIAPEDAITGLLVVPEQLRKLRALVLEGIVPGAQLEARP